MDVSIIYCTLKLRSFHAPVRIPAAPHCWVEQIQLTTFGGDMAILPLQKIEAFHDAAGDKNIQIRTQNDSRLGFLNSLYILTRNEATHRKKNQPNKQ